MSFHWDLRRRTPLGTAVVLAILGLATGAVHAQIGEMAGFTDSMRREYLSRDLTIISEALELDKSQKDILQTLYDDYKADFDKGLEADPKET